MKIFSKTNTFLTVGVSLLLLFACNGSKKTVTNNKKHQLQEIELQPNFNVSATTKLFLNELTKELSKTRQNLRSFNPSEELADKYALRKANDSYLITGFIKTQDEFDRSEMENKGFTFGKAAGNIITVGIPLAFLDSFLKQEGIEYFEISQRAHIK